MPIDLLQDASAESFATWLQAHPSVEIISQGRGTTFADGVTHGAPHALQIADRWHLLHNLSEALEKVLARHHADLKRAFNAEDKPEQSETPEPSTQELSAQAASSSQIEQVQQARREGQLPISMKSIPEMERLFQASKRQVPPFSVDSHPLVQNRSTLQLIYQLAVLCVGSNL